MRHARGPLTALVFLVAAVAACESDGDSQPAARGRVTAAACDHYQRCQQLGPGLTYTSRENCDTQQAAYWETTWPPSECDGKIAAAALDVCLATIAAAECDNLADVVNVIANKCTKAKICAGAP